MTPSARVAAAIEVLDQVIAAARSGGAPADRILAEWFRTHRFAGSKDKRAIREHVYAAIRACGPVPASGRAAMLRALQGEPDLAALFDGSTYGPAPLQPDEEPAAGGLAPAWLAKRLAASGIAEREAAALLARAPLDLRVNRLKLPSGLPNLPVEFEKLAAPDGIRVPAGSVIEQWEAYQEGLLEVQDGGSQLACAAVGAAPGETVIDLCAGAGGKTLALAAAMQRDGGEGTLIAADTDRGRLSRLPPRAARAGAQLAETVLLDPGRELMALAPWQGAADRVLVDAPCSGTGTWRRNPESRWRLDPRALGQLAELQARLLGIAADLLRPGGTLTYVTCSLLDEEGAGQVAAFLAAHPGWQAQRPAVLSDLGVGEPRGAGIRLSPWRDDTDGFFIASLNKPC